MDADDGIPIQHIPLRVLKKIALHLDTGTEHTWESLAEYMGLDAVTILVSCCHVICFIACFLLAVF